MSVEKIILTSSIEINLMFSDANTKLQLIKIYISDNFILFNM